jgi:hypothetical protein
MLDDRWFTGTRSYDNGNCVEVRLVDGLVEVRDSKDRTGPVLRCTRTGWRDLLSAVGRDQFSQS